MSKIISIGTAVPAFCHRQNDILLFMQKIFAMNEAEKRKMKFLYHQSAIDKRYSVIPDYSLPASEWIFYPPTENLEPFPGLEQRMQWYMKQAAPLTVTSIRKCIRDIVPPSGITHLITVSCTGLSAPGLDLQVMELMNLPHHIFRTSINFMGCYAAIHAMKLADAICRSTSGARVLIACTELCTLHFQRENSMDNIASSLLFGDGSAAVLITGDEFPQAGIRLDGFYAEVMPKGKKDMAWELSSSGFLMTLSGFVPALIEEDFRPLVTRALQHSGLSVENISHWCIHPGGKKILEAAEKSLGISRENLQESYQVLNEYGNMSSATLLFVLEKMMKAPAKEKKAQLFGAAFGPGLTMETFTATMAAS